jgi:hypothetical protein
MICLLFYLTKTHWSSFVLRKDKKDDRGQGFEFV